MLALLSLPPVGFATLPTTNTSIAARQGRTWLGFGQDGRPSHESSGHCGLEAARQTEGGWENETRELKLIK